MAKKVKRDQTVRYHLERSKEEGEKVASKL
jgi:hypothetical protein